MRRYIEDILPKHHFLPLKKIHTCNQAMAGAVTPANSARSPVLAGGAFLDGWPPAPPDAGQRTEQRQANSARASGAIGQGSDLHSQDAGGRHHSHRPDVGLPASPAIVPLL